MNGTFNRSQEHVSCIPLQEHIKLLQLSFGSWFKVFSIVIISINGTIAVLSASLNAFFIWVFVRTSSLRKASTYFVFGLVCSDSGVAVLSQPAYCIMKFAEYKGKPSLFCDSGYVFTVTAWLFASISFCTLTCITGDRFVAIKFSLRYRTIVTTRRCWKTLVSIWVICGLIGPVCRVYAQNLISLVTVSVLFSALLCLNCFFLVALSLEIRRHSASIRQNFPSTEIDRQMSSSRRSLKSMYYIAGAFVLCYMPYFVSLLILMFIGGQFTNFFRCLFTVTETLIMVNGLLNPLIYCVGNQEMRSAVCDVLPFTLSRGSERQVREEIEMQEIN